MFLFATPHTGLVVDDIEKMLVEHGNHPRRALLQQIRAKSELLAIQLAAFKNLIRDQKVISFYETEQTRRLEFVRFYNPHESLDTTEFSCQDPESKRWERTGKFFTAVDLDSALLQLPDRIEEKVPLHADHYMIVKFNHRNDTGYTSALAKLKQFERDAPDIVATRFCTCA